MEDEEYKKLPVDERCIHKLWKARVGAYEEVAKLFRQIDDEKSPEFGKYLGLVKKFVVDSNATCQEKGLEATLAYIENYAHAGKTVSEVMSGVVSKAIAAPKTKTRELALQITLMYIEIEKYEAVEEELVKGMDQKNPKIVAACINATTLALSEFGSKIINVKPLVKKITPLFADRDKTVRDEARLMVIEMYKWIGPALKPQLANLQPVQLTELETQFANLEGVKATPSRYIRSQQHKQRVQSAENEVIEGDASDDGEEESDAAQMDAYDLATPVDILSKLPKDFYENIEEKKWQQRKEVLDILENLLKTPKLENGDYGDLVRALRKVVQKDSNVVVVASAGRCIASLASGLKKRFQTYASCCVSPILEKFKEKKQNVLLAMRDAIDAVYLTTTIETIMEDVVESLGNKNPSVKSETALFLTRAFTKTVPTAINKKILKTLITPLIKNINEPDPAVRDASADSIGTLMKLMGDKTVAPFLVDLEKDNLKMTKIRECCEKAVITVKTTVKKERPTTAPAKPTRAKVVKPGNSAPKSAPNTARPSQPAKKKEISSGTATVVRSKAKPAPKATPKPIERDLSDSEVDELAGNVVGEKLATEMADTNWKTRLAAVEQFLSSIQEQEAKDLPTQALIRSLAKKPGLKDTNFQVLKAKLDVVKYLAENSKFSTTTSNYCLTDICEKFGDPKNGSLAAETMTAIADATTFSSVAAVIVDFALGQKNPKVTQEVLLWLSNSIKDFGFANLNAKSIIDNTKKALSSTNPGVRQAAITLCGVLYLYMGPTLSMFFENEKPALRDQICVECDKYEGQKPPQPTKGSVVKSGSSNCLDDLDEDESGGGGDEVVPPNLQDLLPRVDISGQITEALINEIDDKNWKVRNEALGKVMAILQENKFIKPNLGELPQPLVRRMSDSNTKIAQAALNICEAIAKAMGAPCKQYVKVFFPCFLQNLGDNKSWMRATAVDAINAYADQCGYKEFFENEMIGDALKSGSPVLRIELWQWLADKLPKIPPKSIPKEELTICVPHLYSNLEDRNADVRKNAQEAILGIMIHIGYENMVKQTEKLKPGSKNVIATALEKVRPNLPAKPLPTKKQPEKEDKVVRGTKAVTSSKTAIKTKGSASSTKTAPSSGGGGGGRKKDDDVDLSPFLVVNNMKHQRTIDESKLKVLRWNFTTPREEFVDLLRDQMGAANVNKSLIFNMFHSDFRYHIKAIESLTEDLPTNGQALIANLDLILKWITLRFFDTNPSVLLKGLDYLNLVFCMLIETKYHMLESEASSFLPYLVLKMGDPKDSVRSGVRSLLNQIFEVYPISRLFTYVMEGLKSKNARQRAECLEVMGSFINEFGITICTPSAGACLKEVAKQISDRDNSVRNAALNCVTYAYNLVGEKVYKMVGNISDKDLSLLEERIKRASKKMLAKPPRQESTSQISPVCNNNIQPEIEDKNGNGDLQNQGENYGDEEEDEDNLPPMIMPPQAIQQVNEVVGPFQLDPDLLRELDSHPGVPIFEPLPSIDLEFLKEEIRIPTLSEAEMKIMSMPLSPPKPLDINMTLRIKKPLVAKSKDPVLGKNIVDMGSGDRDRATQGMTQVANFLQANKSNLTSAMVDYEDEFMASITSQLKHLRNLDPVADSAITKHYRNLLMVIDAFYHNTYLGSRISVDELKNILRELITLLVENKLEHCPNGDAYIRIINLHVTKIMEKSDHTRMICALIQLMHECIRDEYSARHTDLVMKCIWRILKMMPTWNPDEIDFDEVLLDVHNFLKEFPSPWWKNKPLDTALRTIKTVMHSSCKLKGGSIMLHLGKIPNTSESEVEVYILKLLKTLKIEEVRQMPVKTDSQRRPLSRANHNMLTDIFQKIGSKDETKEGLTLLYDFMQQHPEADIEPFLKKSSKFFQDYIQDGLRDIEESRKVVTTDLENLKGPEYWRARLDAIIIGTKGYGNDLTN